MQPPVNRRLTRKILSVGIGLAGCWLSAAGGPSIEEPAEGDIVTLPVFNVTGERLLPPPESWRHGEIPGFEILSNDSDRNTRRLIQRFQEFQQALSVIWPGVDERISAPTTIVVCGKLGSFAEFRPSDEPDTRLGATSRYYRDADSAVIIVDSNTTFLDLNPYRDEVSVTDYGEDTVPDFSEPVIEVSARTEMFREFVLFQLKGLGPRLPAWFEAGLAELVVSTDISPKRIVFGKIRAPSRVIQTGAGAITSTDPTLGPVFNLELNRRGLIPFGELFTVKHDSDLAKNPIGNKWVQESCAFLHMCLYGWKTTLQKPLLHFVNRSRNEPVTEALFKECFGKDYKAMQLQLRGYIQGGASTYLKYEARGQGMPTPPLVQLDEASDADVGRIKGNALRLAGLPERARMNLIAAYNRGSRDPELLAALGLSELEAGEPDRALTLLEAAEAGTQRPRAHVELARLRLKQSSDTPEGLEGGLSAAQTARILKPLFEARRRPPLAADGYDLIAEVWSRTEIHPRRGNLQVLDEGILLYPNRVPLVLRAAELNSKFGFAEHSAVLAAFGMRIAADSQTRARFESILARHAATAP